jgi:hypothetical protein
MCDVLQNMLQMYSPIFEKEKMCEQVSCERDFEGNTMTLLRHRV